ncbi:MAG: hypothetical protein D6679_06930 [Candidatus Hydrogenedentota bacterium]|nr:MAG: hypothetical protein D6679_06930 [Candidatus Hydrogenedentota bacterium]
MTAEQFVEALRRALVDVLVPEIRNVSTVMQDLRKEMNERFAKVEERFAALQREMNERFAKVEERFAALQREMDERFAKVDERFAALQKEMDGRFAALQREMDERFAKMDERFAKMDGKLDILIERDRRFDEVLRIDSRLRAVEEKVERIISAA